MRNFSRQILASENFLRLLHLQIGVAHNFEINCNFLAQESLNCGHISAHLFFFQVIYDNLIVFLLLILL